MSRAQGTLDICRRRTWAEQQCPAERMAFWATKPASQPAPMAGCMPEWVSHVEIYTHERGEDSVWASRRFKFKTFEPAQLPPDTASPHLRFEQLPCVQLGGAAEPSPDGCRGEDVEELEDYFVVQTCPKPGMVSMQPDGFGQPGQAQAGVYGGLPPALAGGSGKGKGDPAGAAPPLTKSRSMEIAGSAGSRDPVWGLGGRDEDIFAQKGGGEQQLVDLDWGEEEGEGSDEPGRERGEDEHGSPGLVRPRLSFACPDRSPRTDVGAWLCQAASSMLLFDEELDVGAGQNRLSAAPTREKDPAAQADLLDFVLEGELAAVRANVGASGRESS